MTTPLYVLKPISPGYKEVLLPPGTKFIGRSAATGIKSPVVSRKHVEIAVETGGCKVRYCAKYKSEVKINDAPVKKEWVQFPVDSRLDLLANPAEAFPYRLERYTTASSAPPAGSTGGKTGGNTAAVACDQHREMTTRLNCPMCYDLYVDPTELDCNGRHLFCHSCIHDVLTSEGCTNKCPVCNTEISLERRTQILQAGRKRGASGVPVGSAKYQSQAVGLVQDMIEWLIDKRMVDYDDETEWRRRTGLKPLPPPQTSSGGGSGSGAGASGEGGRRSAPPLPFGGGSGGAPGGAHTSGIFRTSGGGGGNADVIDLLSDSPEEDNDEEEDSYSEDEDDF